MFGFDKVRFGGARIALYQRPYATDLGRGGKCLLLGAVVKVTGQPVTFFHDRQLPARLQ
jgi:hypothetical protein